MQLNNKYVFSSLIQFYEIGMFNEHIQSLIQMTEPITNKQNITIDLCFNFQQKFEKIDWYKFYEQHGNGRVFINEYYGFILFKEQFGKIWGKLPSELDVKISYIFDDVPFYNIAHSRRDICWKYTNTHDFICWNEVDSLWPKQTLFALETLHEQVSGQYPKYVANFAGRKNWDKSWDVITHPLFESIPYQDDENWIFNNPASEKSYMSLEQMNEINNISPDKIQVQALTEPKADGSCLVFTSELLKSGVTLPHSLIHHGEDESILRIAKRIMGDDFVQFNFKNILRVHNRRHPQKRKFILNEDNPTGICNAEKKGNWWVELEEKSKHNLETLFKQVKSKSL